jgi:UDP-N-acetyl-D-galactosamine dehydrogenase
LRNSRVIDVINELSSYGVEVQVHDPVADSGEAMHEYGVEITPWDSLSKADALIVAVAHQHYLDLPLQELLNKVKSKGVFVDVKSQFDSQQLQANEMRVWRL